MPDDRHKQPNDRKAKNNGLACLSYQYVWFCMLFLPVFICSISVALADPEVNLKGTIINDKMLQEMDLRGLNRFGHPNLPQHRFNLPLHLVHVGHAVHSE